MLAILDDGFSIVSQVDYQEYHELDTNKTVDTGIATSATLLSKLLKINLRGNLSSEESSGDIKNCKQKKYILTFHFFLNL